jgi:hypothetical protein
VNKPSAGRMFKATLKRGDFANLKVTHLAAE